MNFKEKVYKICSSIPKGKVATYGQLAKTCRETQGRPGRWSIHEK